MSASTASQSLQSEPVQSAPKRRAYKACVSCRTKKAKCELDSSQKPPCQKCKRELRDCVFEADRAWTKRLKQNKEPPEGPTCTPTDTLTTTDQSRSQSQSQLQLQKALDRNKSRLGSKQTAFESSFIRGVVASGQDALDILFDAARNQDIENHERSRQQSQGTDGSVPFPAVKLSLQSRVEIRPESISKASPATLRAWNISRFVRSGWLSADEAVTYVDSFFKHMNPQSPILTDMYAPHEAHMTLITREPFLCSAILMVSSRYFYLPGIGSGSRCYFIHQRLWQHCQHLSLRVMYGQEKGSKAKTRTIGTIEALLLMCEWHSRAIHFPPEHDGWDSDIHMRDEQERLPELQSSTARRWLEDVAEPAKRSDRMSWMLANFALSLAYELNIFTEPENQTPHAASLSWPDGEPSTAWRRWRLQRLLYLYNNQLACRLGCLTSIPQNVSRLCTATTDLRFPGKTDDRADSLLMSMMSLTKFFKSMTDVLFPSVSVTKQLVKEDRYHGILDHSLPLLEQWKQQNIQKSELPANSNAVLEIEYHFVRAYTNSIGMQALCERVYSDAQNGHASHQTSTVAEVGLSIIEHDDINRQYVRNVVDSALAIVQIVVDMGEVGALRCAPVRVFLRITTAYVFLFKAISLGVNKHQLQSMLDRMDKGIAALHASSLDDMHLASHYATLLEIHLRHLRKNLVVSAVPGGRPPPVVHVTEAAQSNSDSIPSALPGNGSNDLAGPGMTSDLAFTLDTGSEASASNDWMFGLPFDPSMAPFGSDSAPGFPPALDDGALDFLWNLNTGQSLL